MERLFTYTPLTVSYEIVPLLMDLQEGGGGWRLGAANTHATYIRIRHTRPVGPCSTYVCTAAASNLLLAGFGWLKVEVIVSEDGDGLGKGGQACKLA